MKCWKESGSKSSTNFKQNTSKKKKESVTYRTGNPLQLGESKTFNKEGIPSVWMAPINARDTDLGKRK